MFCSMTNCLIRRRTVIEHWPKANEKGVLERLYYRVLTGRVGKLEPPAGVNRFKLWIKPAGIN